MDQIIVRARQLAAMHPKGVGVDLLRSMTVGAFRKYLCLDDENHGQGEMDLGQLSTKSKEKFQEWRTKGDGIFWPCHVLKRIDALEKSAEEALMAFKLLFQDEIKRIAEVMLRAVSEAGVVCGLEDKSPRCRAQG